MYASVFACDVLQRVAASSCCPQNFHCRCMNGNAWCSWDLTHILREQHRTQWLTHTPEQPPTCCTICWHAHSAHLCENVMLTSKQICMDYINMIVAILKWKTRLPPIKLLHKKMNHAFDNNFQLDTNRFGQWVGTACSSSAHPGTSPVKTSDQSCQKIDSTMRLVLVYTKDHRTSTILLLYEILMMLNRIHFCFFVVVISAQWGFAGFVLLRWSSIEFVFYLVIHSVTIAWFIAYTINMLELIT